MIKRLNNKKSLIYKTTVKGFSLVEVILAISIFTLCVMGLTGGLIYGQQSGVIASNRGQAILLANEGIEATQNIADESYTNLVDGDFGLTIINNSYSLTNNPDVWDIYERQITISSIDMNTKQVEVVVSWPQNAIDRSQVSFTTYITNWK